MLARRFDERGQNQRPVGRAEQRVDGVLRMGHESEDVARLVGDACDVVDGAVGVVARRVAQDDADSRGCALVRRQVIAPGRVLDGDREPVAEEIGRASCRERVFGYV